MTVKAAVILFPFVSTAVFAVYHNRKTSREHLQNLDAYKERLDEQAEQFHAEAKTKEARARVQKMKNRDQEWFEKERTVQMQWQARPFYRQIVFPPTPAYADV